MNRNRNRDDQNPPNPPTQGNHVYGTAPQQVSPNTPNTSQTVSPVIIYAYPPHMTPQQQAAPTYAAPPPPPQYAQPQYAQPPQPPHAYGGGCPYQNNAPSPCQRRPRKRRLLKFLLFVGLIWFTAVMSYRHGGKVVKLMQMRKIAKEMDLSHQQRHQLKGIFWDAMHKNRAHRSKMIQMRQEMLQVMAKPDLTQKELDAFLLKSTEQIQKIVLSNSGHLFKARAVLTPGQRHILLARLQQLQRRRWSRRWRRHRHHARHHGYDYQVAPKAATTQPKTTTTAAKTAATQPKAKAPQVAANPQGPEKTPRTAQADKTKTPAQPAALLAR